MEFALGGDVLLLQQPAHLFHALGEALAALIDADAEAGEFMRQEGARETRLHAALRDRIQHGDLAGELERVVEYRQHRAGDQARRLGALGRGGEENDRVGRIAAVRVEIMLDRADMAPAVAVAKIDQPQAFVEILRAAFLLRPDTGEELHPEIHGALPGGLIGSIDADCAHAVKFPAML